MEIVETTILVLLASQIFMGLAILYLFKELNWLRQYHDNEVIAIWAKLNRELREQNSKLKDLTRDGDHP